MSVNTNFSQLFSVMHTSLEQKNFVKLALSNYLGQDSELKSLQVKSIIIKNERKLSITSRYKTKDVIKNYGLDEGITLLRLALENDFKAAILYTTDHDWHYQTVRNHKTTLTKKTATIKQAPSLDHDRTKNRILAPQGKYYLEALGVTDAQGIVYKNAQDKYRQINRYIEILDSLIKPLNWKGSPKIVDMGAGKGYLTFALYDYLTNKNAITPVIHGVEYRQDLVDMCNKIAHESQFKQLKFIQGAIESYPTDDITMLIALHACNTATDDAIAKGITSGAELIVVAPCCHKQIRQEMEDHASRHPDLGFLLQNGIFLERQAEMVTDGLRALILNYFGYQTKVFEFISDAHTPKNVMIVGTKMAKMPVKDPKILQDIQRIKTYFGIKEHYLEKLFKL